MWNHLCWRKKVYFNLVDHKKRDKIIRTFASHEKFRKKTSKGPNIFPICYYAYGKIDITGWRAILKEKLKVNKHSNIPCEESWVKKKVKNKEKQAVKTPADKTSDNKISVDDISVDEIIADIFSKKDRKKYSSTYHIESGHVFGRFTNLTPLIGDILGSDQNVDNINIYPQFRDANAKVGKTDRNPQSFFEGEAGSNLPCYYEAEAIFKEWTDVVPIGTRIRIIDPKTFKELYHVFVPNCETHPSDSVQSSENSAEAYRAYFKRGEVKKLNVE